MNREFLKGLLGENATKEIIDSIMAENGKDIESEKSKATLIQNQLDTANQTLKDRDKQLETLKNSTGDIDGLKAQIAQLQDDNKLAKQTHEKEINEMKLNHAVEAEVRDAKAKNVKAVVALLNLKDAKIGEDGKVVGLKEQLDALTKSDDYLFTKTTTQVEGFDPDNSNPNPKGNKPDSEKTYEDFIAELEQQ